jgi:hypothetical protein
MPVHLYCEPRPVSRAGSAVGLNARRTGQGVHIHDLCVRSSVTRFVIYTVTLVYCVHICCKLHTITFAAGVCTPALQ